MPRRRTRQRWLRVFRRAPIPVQAALGCAAIVAMWFAANGVYQVARKPTELFFPVSGTLYKTPSQTWRTYGRLFRRHSTPVMSAELLAALAQVEGSGNPVARTYWRWALSHDPFDIYRPASSAVGMYQITDGTFEEARRWCIHDHRAVEDGPWHDVRSCWLNALYIRVLPTHAIELTSAHLDRQVARTLARHGIEHATLEQKQDLAAVVHLCGGGAGSAYARRGLEALPGQRCGAHSLEAYLDKVDAMKALFARLGERS
ncbi:MAG: lytic transglycosylase domain-containing protein [Gammaproteobacteria bacterium]|nr:lytic transglycosylase domain-containing protein [Gammaproteobacteria bacterium]